MGHASPPLPPGYFECRFARRRLNRFRDLVLHRKRWAHHPRPLTSLAKLIPAVPAGSERQWLITRELNLLVPQVAWDLKRAGVSTTIARVGQEEPSDIDLVTGFDQLDQFVASADARLDDALLGCLDRGLGAYAVRSRQAFGELFNPFLVISSVLRLPVFVLQRADLDASMVRTRMTETYTWALRLTILALLILAAAKLGVSIPWERFTSLVGAK